MFCPNCGNKINNNEDFCSECGTSLNKASTLPNGSKKNNKLILASIIVILLIVSGALLVNSFFESDKESETEIETEYQENESNEEVSFEDTSSSYEKLSNAYKNSELTADEYIMQLAYLQYDKSLLSEEYQSDIVDYYNGVLEDAYELKDELLIDTVQYLYDNISLNNVEFVTTSTLVPVSNTDESNINSLDQVILSDEGNFIVWYSETGLNATTKEIAQNLANGLEESVSEYENLFNVTYEYEINIIFENSKYDAQIEILNNNNISEETFENSMSVYLLEADSDSLATYYSGYWWLVNLLFSLSGEDVNGGVAEPYIVIKPSSFEGDEESLEQLYNHELFHHFQYQVFCGTTDCDDNADYMVEATANWASSLITYKTNTDGFLNRWSNSFISYSGTIFTDLLDENDESTVGYLIYPYIYAYQQNVSDSLNIIVNSIYEDDNDLLYLNSNATSEELKNTINYVAYKNLVQNYDNYNLISSEYTGEVLVPYTDISSNYTSDIIELSQIGINYYFIGDNGSYSVSLENSSNDSLKTVLLVAKSNESYEIIKELDFNENISFEIESSDVYSEYYLIVSNSSLIDSSSYGIVVEKNSVENDSSAISYDNYKYTMTSTIDLNVSGISMSTVTTTTVTSDNINQIEYLESVTEVMGFSTTTLTYIDYKNGYSYTQVPYSSEWIKEKSISRTFDLETVINKFLSENSISTLVDGTYELDLDVSDISGSVSSDYTVTSGTISTTIYISQNIVKTIKYDLSSLLSAVDNYEIEIQFLSYGSSTELIIPDDALNS